MIPSLVLVAAVGRVLHRFSFLPVTFRLLA
jgi:hypothetical protein